METSPPSYLPRAVRLVRIPRRGSHEHTGGNQARTEKGKKEVGQATASVEWLGGGSKSFGRFNEPRNKERGEARLVGCWQSGDCPGGEEAVGET